MKTRCPLRPRNWLWLLGALSFIPAFAADEAALRKDLTAVIALLGRPCGQVVDATEKSATDHVATCANGMRYRVYVNAEGRVVAEKQ